MSVLALVEVVKLIEVVVTGTGAVRSCSHAIDVEIVGNEAGVAGVEGHDDEVAGGIHDGDEE